MSLNEPGALYDATNAPDLPDVPVMAKCNPDSTVWQEQSLKTQSSKFQWIPRGGVKMFMGVLDEEIVGPYFMWGQHKLPSIHNDPGGLSGVRGVLG